MPRIHEDFITAFTDYASYGEAPSHVYFWVGVSTVAGALQRKCWIDQYYFRWYPNSYIILVAPPGEISKTTTAGIGMRLLKQLPSIHFGPNVVTWPALVKHMASCVEEFEADGEIMQQSALTINSSEFGNLLNPQDSEMVDMMVTLWDGEDIRKMTKSSGTDEVPNPLLNVIACTTPSWIASAIPEYMLGGGLLSRCLFVFADEKARYVAYPGLSIPKDMKERGQLLVEDLERISKLTGEFALTREAIAWGEEWYANLTKERRVADARIKDFMARKQTHVHKLAMILSASRSDSLVIDRCDLELAAQKITELEARMPEVFDSIGRNADAVQSNSILDAVQKAGKMSVPECYNRVRTHYPKYTDFMNILNGLIHSGNMTMVNEGGTFFVSAKR